MKIFIITPAEQTVTVDVDANETIEDLKSHIEACEGTPTEKQQFVYAGKLLKDEQTLSDYNIGEDATLYLAVQVKGGFWDLAAGLMALGSLIATGIAAGVFFS